MAAAPAPVVIRSGWRAGETSARRGSKQPWVLASRKSEPDGRQSKRRGPASIQSSSNERSGAFQFGVCSHVKWAARATPTIARRFSVGGVGHQMEALGESSSGKKKRHEGVRGAYVLRRTNRKPDLPGPCEQASPWPLRIPAAPSTWPRSPAASAHGNPEKAK